VLFWYRLFVEGVWEGIIDHHVICGFAWYFVTKSCNIQASSLVFLGKGFLCFPYQFSASPSLNSSINQIIFQPAITQGHKPSIFLAAGSRVSEEAKGGIPYPGVLSRGGGSPV